MYDYKKEVQWIFTDRGQRQFLSIRDRAALLTKEAGACTINALFRTQSGDSYHILACIDRLVELGDYKYLDNDDTTQNKVLVPL